MNFEETYCQIDDFCKVFEEIYRKKLIEGKERKRNRSSSLSQSEIITILVLFQRSGQRTFKNFYLYLLQYHRREFPGLVSYPRFVQLIPRVLIPATAFLQSKMGEVTGISFIDSTSIAVCKPKRIKSNKVFKDVAKIGKTTIGWFFGFKCHIVVNEMGEILSFLFTQGNVDDRVPVPKLSKKLYGKLFGDKGYISQTLFMELLEKGTQLITGIKNNMKNCLIPLVDKLLLRKRSIIETVFDLLKHECHIEHSRHRSVANFCVNLISALTSYTLRHSKPAITRVLAL